MNTTTPLSAEDLYRKCVACSGSGVVVNIRTEQKCCGYHDLDGGCCNMPVADYQPVQEQCERCQATGFEPVDPEEYALSRTPEVSEELLWELIQYCEELERSVMPYRGTSLLLLKLKSSLQYLGRTAPTNSEEPNK